MATMNAQKAVNTRLLPELALANYGVHDGYVANNEARFEDGSQVVKLFSPAENFILVLGQTVVGTATALAVLRNGAVAYQISGFVLDLDFELYADEADGVLQTVPGIIFGGADTQNGSPFNDTLAGFNGNDTLRGFGGIDILIGGLGGDGLSGGAAADRFDFNAIGESTVAVGGRDTINGFSHAQHDHIDLATIDADQRPANPGNDVFKFIGSQSFAAYHAAHPGVFGMVRFAGGVLQGTVDADMTAEFAINVTAAANLIVGDFFL